MSVQNTNISLTSIVSRPSNDQCELGEARKTLLGSKAWRGLSKDYSFVRSLDKEYSWFINSQQRVGD